MHLDDLRDHCLDKPGATEDLPFGPDTLVFKVAGKMFALLNLERLPQAVVLKAEPARTADLRARYDGVRGGPYFPESQLHWSYVELKSDVPADLVRDLVDHSYDRVVAGLTRKARAELLGSEGA